MAAVASTQNSTSPMASCENCGQLTRLHCSRCRSVPICSHECMPAIWKTHKAECTNIVKTQQLVTEQMRTAAAEPEMQSYLLLGMPPEDYRAIDQHSLDVFHRHTVSELPPKGSTMGSRKKLALYLDMLSVHDTLSGANRELPLDSKMLLNRRYNNTYRHAIANLSHGELDRLNAMMRANHVSAAYQRVEGRGKPSIG